MAFWRRRLGLVVGLVGLIVGCGLDTSGARPEAGGGASAATTTTTTTTSTTSAGGMATTTTTSSSGGGGMGAGGSSGGAGGEGGTPIVTPEELPNLFLWLRADLGVTEVANAVSQWVGQGPAMRTYEQVLATNQPQLVASVASLGGRPAIDFDGLNDALVGNLGTGSASTSHTFVAVVEADTGDATSRWIWGSENGQLAFYHSHVTAQGQYGVFAGGTSVDSGTASSPGRAVLQWTVDAGSQSYSFSRDGSMAPGGIYTGFPLTGGSAVGSLYLGSTFFFDGRIAEIILYDRVLNATELATIADYVADRY